MRESSGEGKNVVFFLIVVALIIPNALILVRKFAEYFRKNVSPIKQKFAWQNTAKPTGASNS